MPKAYTRASWVKLSFAKLNRIVAVVGVYFFMRFLDRHIFRVK